MSDKLDPAATAEAAYERAVAKATDVHGIAMNDAGEKLYVALKDSNVSFETASAAADSAFESAKVAAFAAHALASITETLDGMHAEDKRLLSSLRSNFDTLKSSYVAPASERKPKSD